MFFVVATLLVQLGANIETPLKVEGLVREFVAMLREKRLTVEPSIEIVDVSVRLDISVDSLAAGMGLVAQSRYTSNALSEEYRIQFFRNLILRAQKGKWNDICLVALEFVNGMPRRVVGYAVLAPLTGQGYEKHTRAEAGLYENSDLLLCENFPEARAFFDVGVNVLPGLEWERCLRLFARPRQTPLLLQRLVTKHAACIEREVRGSKIVYTASDFSNVRKLMLDHVLFRPMQKSDHLGNKLEEIQVKAVESPAPDREDKGLPGCDSAQTKVSTFMEQRSLRLRRLPQLLAIHETATSIKTSMLA